MESDNEGHLIEYKDFSKTSSKDLKSIKSKLFKEISAFANSQGGKLIVGIDDDKKNNIPQPEHILKLLEKDSLTRIMNSLSNNLIILDSIEKDRVITIAVQKSEDVISALKDAKDLNQGEVYIKKNAETVKAKPDEILKLVEQKNISLDKKLKRLRDIVHQKFVNGKNNASELNIFDSLVITVTDENKYIETTFDKFMCLQFYAGYKLPLSKNTTMQMILEIFDSFLTFDKQFNNVSLNTRKGTLDKLAKSSKSFSNLINGWRDEVYNSAQLNNYLDEYNITK